MSDGKPDFSLENVTSKRSDGPPALFLVKHFQIGEAHYMKPPLEEQLVDPDGSILYGTRLKSACTCNSVCACVPVSACACNSVCVCNTVSRETYHSAIAPPIIISSLEKDKSTKVETTVTHPTISGELKPGSSTSRSSSRSSRSRTSGSRSSGGGVGGYWAPCF